MPNVNIICLSHNGSIDIVPINSNTSVSSFTKNDLKSKTKLTFGDSELERECDYDYKDKFVTIYASSKGNDNVTNKHELPPPIDKNTYYGDIFALYHENEKLINMTLDEYKEFYETAFGGFEDLNGDETDVDNSEVDDDDDSDLDGFIVNDSEADTSDYHTCEEDDDSDDESDEVDEDELLEQYDVYKHYVDSMRKSGKSATKTIQDKLKSMYDELKRRNII
jgi:hypothetical protein